MKQLDMTPELSALIKSRVGQDVDTSKLTVFETIALNTKPLPGKRGGFFEQAVVKPVTLAQMVQSINDGNHLPLMSDHEMLGEPKGRFFHAALDTDEDGALEMRGLFYLDSTEARLIEKTNAGSMDEVSVSFLSTSAECSECGWDYFSQGTAENIYDRTCANGHEIGTNGAHVNLIGLNQFTELSLVARGAADKPKIIGKSEAKLAPSNAQRLAAKGFEPDALVVRASLGIEEVNMDLTAALTQISTLSTEKGTLAANLTAAETARDAATADVTRLNTELAAEREKVTALTAEKEELAKRPEATVQTELTEAVTYLQEQYNHLLVASGKAKAEGDALPSKPAELKAKISELTGNLTSILPVGGVSKAPGSETDAGKPSENVKLAFKVNKN